MALRNMVYEGDSRLAKVCRPVTVVNDHIVKLIEDMEETLAANNGVGLAAPQVGVMRRIAIVDAGDRILDLIDPHIIETEGSQTGVEGCLSCPDRWGVVTRPMKVTVRATNRRGECYTYTGEGLTARCICHECDHLDGILFTQKAERMLTPKEVKEYLGEED